MSACWSYALGSNYGCVAEVCVTKDWKTQNGNLDYCILKRRKFPKKHSSNYRKVIIICLQSQAPIQFKQNTKHTRRESCMACLDFMRSRVFLIFSFADKAKTYDFKVSWKLIKLVIIVFQFILWVFSVNWLLIECSLTKDRKMHNIVIWKCLLFIYTSDEKLWILTRLSRDILLLFPIAVTVAGVNYVINRL